jgi:hypothetical protein
MSTEKRNGKTQAQNPVESSALFGHEIVITKTRSKITPSFLLGSGECRRWNGVTHRYSGLTRREIQDLSHPDMSQV